MHLLLSLFLAWMTTMAMADAPKPMISPKALPVKEKAGEQYRTLLYVQRGEKLWKMSEDGTYTRIKIKKNGKWIAGYIATEDLNSAMEAAAPAPKTVSKLGLGFGAIFSRLSQTGKTFETDDEVKYTLSSYASQTYWPFLVGQWGRKDFWRVRFGYRLTQFRGSAKSDVSATIQKPVEVNHRMISLAVDRTWSFGAFYVGAGAEAAHALSMIVKLGGTELPTESQDLPTYVGPAAVLGAQTFFGEKVSLYAELRITAFMNQQQPITALEGGGAAVYWY